MLHLSSFQSFSGESGYGGTNRERHICIQVNAGVARRACVPASPTKPPHSTTGGCTTRPHSRQVIGNSSHPRDEVAPSRSLAWCVECLVDCATDRLHRLIPRVESGEMCSRSVER